MWDIFLERLGATVHNHEIGISNHANVVGLCAWQDNITILFRIIR
jgi:hypothetical protein